MLIAHHSRKKYRHECAKTARFSIDCQQKNPYHVFIVRESRPASGGGHEDNVVFVINWFLMMVFFACSTTGDYTRYDEMKASGQYPCYGYIETPWDPTQIGRAHV